MVRISCQLSAIRSSTHLSHCTAFDVPGKCPHSGHDPNSIDVVNNIVQHLNPGQTPVVTFDQPLFALAKQIQWKWPQDYGEDKVALKTWETG